MGNGSSSRSSDVLISSDRDEVLTSSERDEIRMLERGSLKNCMFLIARIADVFERVKENAQLRVDCNI